MAIDACASLLPADASRKAQGEAARVGGEVACTRHVKRLVELRDQGWSCEKAKEQAALENPLCTLSFTCPRHEAWEMGPDVEGAAAQ